MSDPLVLAARGGRKHLFGHIKGLVGIVGVGEVGTDDVQLWFASEEMDVQASGQTVRSMGDRVGHLPALPSNAVAHAQDLVLSYETVCMRACVGRARGESSHLDKGRPR